MSFARAVAFVLSQEGGLVDDPRDPGGLSNKGIALKKHPELTAEDIRTMSVTRASSIYFDQYWTKVSGSSWPDAVGVVMLDMAVNMGTFAAIQCLQLACGVSADGIAGQRTIEAANAAEPKGLVARLTGERIKRYSSMTAWPIYGKGWVTRSIAAALEGVTGT